MKTLLFVFTMLALSDQQMLACSCREIQKVKDDLKWANVVFTGEVVKVRFIENEVKNENKFGYEYRTIVTFRVSGYWKGKVGQKITLHTFNHGYLCEGHYFKEGEKYIVYATRRKARWWLNDGSTRTILSGVGYPRSHDNILGTSRCSRTRELVRATEDLKELGPPKIPK